MAPAHCIAPPTSIIVSQSQSMKRSFSTAAAAAPAMTASSDRHYQSQCHQPPRPSANSGLEVECTLPQPSAIRTRCVSADTAQTQTPPASSASLPSEVQVYDRQRSSEHADIFHQWEALVERENSEAYLLPRITQDPRSRADEKSREELCLWCYRVVDEYDLDRSIVSTALSYFDSLLPRGMVAKSEWPLALMTCLYLAIKVVSYSGKIFAPSQIAKFSRGLFEKEDIVAMEMRICEGFGWCLNPPVSDNYVNVLTPLLMSELPSSTASPGKDCSIETAMDFYRQGDNDDDLDNTTDNDNDEVRHHLIQQAKFLSERSVLDSFFSSKHPSSIAYATLTAAMELMRFPLATKKWFASLPLDHDPEEAKACSARLLEICAAEQYVPAVTVPELRRERAESPRTVTPIKATTTVDDDNNGIVAVVPSPIKRIAATVPSPIKRSRSSSHKVQKSYFGLSSEEEEEEEVVEIMSPKMRRIQ